MSHRLATLASVALVALAARAPAQTLGVGDPAPAIKAALVKGDAVPTTLAPGKVYVVEFWATWCPPCRTSIPHITELQKRYPQVQIIGVSTDHERGKVAPFVEKMGEKMLYTVALDDERGATSKAWMEASGQGGIPTSFIVGTDGKIAWIGHPMQMDKPLELVVAGKWDAKAFAERAAKLKELYAKIESAMEAKDFETVLASIDAAVALEPDEEKNLGMAKFGTLLESKAYDKAYGYGRRLTDVVFKDSAGALNGLAWTIVDPDSKLEKRDLELALAAALRANELTEHKEPSILDTLAAVHFHKGDLAKAIEVQSKAVELSKGTRFEADLGARLEQYKKAAENQKN